MIKTAKQTPFQHSQLRMQFVLWLKQQITLAPSQDHSEYQKRGIVFSDMFRYLVKFY